MGPAWGVGQLLASFECNFSLLFLYGVKISRCKNPHKNNKFWSNLPNWICIYIYIFFFSSETCVCEVKGHIQTRNLYYKFRHRACEPASAQSGVSQSPASAASLALWALGLRTLKGPEGGLLGGSWGLSELLLLPFLGAFFDMSWNRYFSDSGANLGPSCLPTWHQNLTNSMPREVHMQSQIASYLRCLFYRFGKLLGSSFGRFWVAS